MSPPPPPAPGVSTRPPSNIPRSAVLEPVMHAPHPQGLLRPPDTQVLEPVVSPSLPPNTHMCIPSGLTAAFALPSLATPAPGFPGASVSKESARSVGGLGSIPGSGRSPGGEKGYPLQHSGLEKSMDRGAWQASPCGCKESDTSDSGQNLDRLLTAPGLPSLEECGLCRRPHTPLMRSLC